MPELKHPLVVSVPDRALLESLLALGPLPDVSIEVWDLAEPPPCEKFDIVVAPYLSGPTPLANLKGLEVGLVQGQLAGYDGVEHFLPAGLVFANAASVHETSTAELALALILASQRGIPDFVRDAAEGRWRFVLHQSLADRRVLLVGYGGIGQAIEARLTPFEVTIDRVGRTRRTADTGEVHDLSSLPGLLGLADIVVVAVPLSTETHNLVNDNFLSMMRDGSLLVNVSRGPVANTEALVAHARHGRLRLALDVVDPEPLPDGHPLFSMPNVLISPHVGGATTAMAPRMARLLRHQIERVQRGEDPLNIVLRT